MRAMAATAGVRAWVIRLGLVAVAFVALWAAQIADERFRETMAAAFRFDVRQYSATVTPLMIAGACFAAAARFPFPRPRFAWGRLLLAAIALVPALHLALYTWAPQFHVHWPTVVITPRWFDDGSIPAAGAVLAGVAIGCGFGARREAA
jgi:hypothetical protein